MKSYEVTRHVKGYKIHAVFPAEVSSVEPDNKWKGTNYELKVMTHSFKTLRHNFLKLVRQLFFINLTNPNLHTYATYFASCWKAINFIQKIWSWPEKVMVTIFLEVTFPSQAKVQFWPAWHSMAQHGTLWQSMTQHDTTWQSMAQHGTVWHSMAKYGTAWHSMAKYDTVWHSVTVCEWKRQIQNRRCAIMKANTGHTRIYLQRFGMFRIWQEILTWDIVTIPAAIKKSLTEYFMKNPEI